MEKPRQCVFPMMRAILTLLLFFCLCTARSQERADDAVVKKLATHVWVRVRACHNDSCVKVTDTSYITFQQASYDDMPDIHSGHITCLFPSAAVLKRDRVSGAPNYYVGHNATPTLFFADTVVNGKHSWLCFTSDKNEMCKVQIFYSTDELPLRLTIIKQAIKNKQTGKWDLVNDRDTYYAVEPPKEIFDMREEFHY